MFALLSELKLWTLNEDVCIKDTDFGAFRYYDKRIENVYAEGKRSYCEKRGMIYTPQNKKGIKLKDSLKYLEEQLKDHSTIYCQWNDHCTVTLMLGTGLLIYIQISVQSNDIEKIVFDKYLVGKLSDHISDVVITKNHLVCTYNDSQVTMVHFTKTKRHFFDKISRLEPKINSFELCGPSNRRLDKKIQSNRSGDLILIWWKSAMNEIYPWSPTIKEHDRANVQIHRLNGLKMDLICYLRTEYDPLCITFNTLHENVIHSIEQKVSRKGEITIEWRTYEVSQQDKLQRINVVSIPITTHTSCVKFSPNQEMLLLCCIDGSITLHDQPKGTSNTVKAAFIPTFASWHGDGIIFTLGNERGQFQHFDIAFSCIKSQMLTEESTSMNILDLSFYFRNQPILFRMEWSKLPMEEFNIQHYKQSDALFLLLFERGPMGVIKIIEGCNYPGDALIENYLKLELPDKATSLLLSMNWDLHTKNCMHSLNQIVNYLFKFPLTPEREHLIQIALGSFHVPVRPISQIVEEEYGDEVRDLTRRFFHHLLRFRLFEKAFRLAIDLNDHDLFMDIHFYAIAMKDTELANAAKEKAEQILSRSNSCDDSSHSTCSRPSCSLCSDSVSDKDDDSFTDESENNEKLLNLNRNRSKLINSQAPPLPVLHSSLYPNTTNFTIPFNDSKFEKNDGNLRSTFNLSTYLPGSFNNLIHLNSQLNKNSSPSSSSLSLSRQINSNFSQSLSNIESLIPNYSNSNLKSFNNSIDHFGKTSFNGKISDELTNYGKSYGEVSENFEQFGKFCTKEKSFMEKNFSNTQLLETPNEMNLSFNGKSRGLFNPVSSLFYNSNNVPFNDSDDDDDDDDEEEEKEEEEKKIPEKEEEEEEEQKINLISKNSPVFQTIEQKKSQRLSAFDIPPPPSMSTSLAKYIKNLPKKNIPLSRSTSGLIEMEDSLLRLQNSRSISKLGQNSSLNFLLNHNHNHHNHHHHYQHQQQQQQRNSKFQSTKNYKLNYDLNHVPCTASCDNLSTTMRNIYQGRSGNDLKESKLFRIGQEKKEVKKFSNIPPLPVINSNFKHYSMEIANTSSNEKPKVKFSDTVTHILVPGSGQIYRPLQKRSIMQLHPMDPKRELAESLPLCLGNDDYLKDFQPLSKDGTSKTKDPPKTEETAKIKVVHFGLL
ncbi:WD repeat-containing and planar cell polarity effector protein fritz [Leptopilina boulardi]|uniref:WD repeat-containing and planar cell polarity effector protein fritz n=1 Tax=Leptopilina boulardi TaxID=63433 RepID=UPI0021F505B1|nr:WD repeat-containing and planar cell polarity effector protein fritz [Leptopilina boulardi]